MIYVIFFTGLLIFCTVAELQNSGKSAKSRKIHENARNTRKFARNNIKYISETYLGYWGFLLPVNLQIYLETLPQKQANSVPKLAGINDAKNWALAMMMLKALPLAHFSMVLLSKEQMIISVK